MCRSKGFVFDIDNIKLILKSERWMLIVLGQVYMSIMLMSCISISTSRAISNKNALSRFRLQFDSFTESKVRFDHLLNLGVSWSLDVKIYYKLCEFHFVQMLNSHTFIIQCRGVSISALFTIENEADIDTLDNLEPCRSISVGVRRS